MIRKISQCIIRQNEIPLFPNSAAVLRALRQIAALLDAGDGTLGKFFFFGGGEHEKTQRNRGTVIVWGILRGQMLGEGF